MYLTLKGWLGTPDVGAALHVRWVRPARMAVDRSETQGS